MIIHGLPKSTEINKQLPKKAIFDKFKPETAKRNLFDEQISRLAIVAEINPKTVNISQGESVSAIFVIHVSLKTSAVSKENIELLSKLIDQNMLFILEYEGNARLAVYYSKKLFQTVPKPLDELEIKLSGRNLDLVWENIVADIGDISVEEERSLSEQIAVDDERVKLLANIEWLEKLARNEKQPRKKLKYVEKIKNMKKELELLV